MQTHSLLLFFTLSLLTLIPLSSYADSHNVYGIFYTVDKGSKIEISDCGDDSPCGVVIWVDPTTTPNNMPVEDLRTKDGDPILGLTIVQGFKRKKKDWRGGTIYDPGKDKTYASRMRRLDNGNLEVKGCIAFFCVTQIWTQATPKA